MIMRKFYIKKIDRTKVLIKDKNFDKRQKFR